MKRFVFNYRPDSWAFWPAFFMEVGRRPQVWLVLRFLTIELGWRISKDEVKP